MAMGILIWVFLIIVVFFVFVYSRIMKNRIKNEGIETTGTISRIDEELDIDTHDTSYSWYVEYYDENNQRREALLYDAIDLDVGDKIRIKYHPSNYNYAEFIEII